MKMKKELWGAACFAACLLISFLVPSHTAIGTTPDTAQAPSVTLKPDLTIGVEDGDEDLMFGMIARVDLDGQGNIYILDYKFRKVVVCSPDGRHLKTIPVPAGQGPQEATNLGGIAVAPSGTLYINDMRKIIVYGPDGRFVRSFLTDFMISSIGCPGTEDLVAIGPNSGKILHVFDQTGRLLASFGDTFSPPADLEPMKDMPMISAPLVFNCAKDGRVFVLNPHKYEVSVFKDRRLETVLAGKSERFKPIRKMGRAFMSTAAHIVQSGGLVFVSFRDPDPKALKTADIFEAGKTIGSIGLPGTPHVADPQGRIYFAEEDDFPKVVRYAVVKQ
jgi:hypothetical protein